MTRIDNTRKIRSPRGTKLNAKSWLTEAPLRMLMNNLDAEVAERPEELVVYGGIGRAARNWECFDRIVESLKQLEGDETLLIQSGKPVGVFKRISMREGWHSMASSDAPAIVAASGCAPPMPPSPAVRIHLSASSPP